MPFEILLPLATAGAVLGAACFLFCIPLSFDPHCSRRSRNFLLSLGLAFFMVTVWSCRSEESYDDPHVKPLVTNYMLDNYSEKGEGVKILDWVTYEERARYQIGDTRICRVLFTRTSRYTVEIDSVTCSDLPKPKASLGEEPAS